jgi:uncharacterized protein YndB with AHSA1/START domain
MVERKSELTTMEQKGDRELVISRSFDAPARLVFEAWTKPEFVRRWWAPKSHEVQVVSIDADVRVGGAWRYVLKPAQYPQFAFYGEYKEIVPHERLRYSSIFEPYPEAPVDVTVTFEGRGDKTFLVSREVYFDAASLQAALGSGLEHGMRETLDQLNELVRSLAG